MQHSVFDNTLYLYLFGNTATITVCIIYALITNLGRVHASHARTSHGTRSHPLRLSVYLHCPAREVLARRGGNIWGSSVSRDLYEVLLVLHTILFIPCESEGIRKNDYHRHVVPVPTAWVRMIEKEKKWLIQLQILLTSLSESPTSIVCNHTEPPFSVCTQTARKTTRQKQNTTKEATKWDPSTLIHTGDHDHLEPPFGDIRCLLVDVSIKRCTYGVLRADKPALDNARQR